MTNLEQNGQKMPEQTPKQEIVQGTRENLGQIEIEPRNETITIKEIAEALDLQEEEKTLPNGKVVKGVNWKTEDLERVYEYVHQKRVELGLGRHDVMVIDGPAPIWLVPTISHACHPTYTAVRYPQGGPEATLPVNGTRVEGQGVGEGLEYSVTDEGEYTKVEFKISAAEIDAAATMKTLAAPEVPLGKPVHITGRGPVAITAALAEAYAHHVPYVANFQPGTGFVVSISHDAKNPLGTVKA